MTILDKIKKANLVGRGGAGFPTALKWEAVKCAQSKNKYIVVNAAEGEPGVKKDGFILENYPDRVLEGVELAIKFLSAQKVYFYINHDYYKKYSAKLKKIISRLGLKDKIEFFLKPVKSGYIGGEETAILNIIEGRRTEPRLKPPFPTTAGLFGCPTLINNVETFYNVSLVEHNEYYDFRFYTINGPISNPGVYAYPDRWTIKMVLLESKNYPNFPFFVQVGGDASGEVLSSDQLDKVVCGAGSITVYNLVKVKPEKLLKYWLDFFKNSSCGQCTPCREGNYRLVELFNKRPVPWKKIREILNTLEETSFCALGAALPLPVKSYLKNILHDNLQIK